jgi:hypothetical protein
MGNKTIGKERKEDILNVLRQPEKRLLKSGVM